MRTGERDAWDNFLYIYIRCQALKRCYFMWIAPIWLSSDFVQQENSSRDLKGRETRKQGTQPQQISLIKNLGARFATLVKFCKDVGYLAILFAISASKRIEDLYCILSNNWKQIWNTNEVILLVNAIDFVALPNFLPLSPAIGKIIVNCKWFGRPWASSLPFDSRKFCLLKIASPLTSDTMSRFISE